MDGMKKIKTASSRKCAVIDRSSLDKAWLACEFRTGLDGSPNDPNDVALGCREEQMMIIIIYHITNESNFYLY